MKKPTKAIFVVMISAMLMLSACASANSSNASSGEASSSTGSVGNSTSSKSLAGSTREDLSAYIDEFDYDFAGPPSAYRFTLEGRDYSIPCSVKSFVNNGWTLEPGDEFSGGYKGLPDSLPGTSEYASFDVFSGKKQFTLSVIADGASDWEDCKVIAVEYDPESRADRDLDFKLASGVDRDATVEDVLARYGKPLESGSGERNGSAYLASLSYSATGYAEKAARIAQEEERKAQAERDGSVYISASAMSASGAKIFSLRNNYDTLAFSFNSDGGLTSIKMLNSL